MNFAFACILRARVRARMLAVAFAGIGGAAHASDVDLRAPADPRLAPLATGFAVVLDLPADSPAAPEYLPVPSVDLAKRAARAPGLPSQPPRPQSGAAPDKPPEFEPPATL